MTKHILFIGDPIESLVNNQDSTWLIIQEALRRSYDVFYSSEVFLDHALGPSCIGLKIDDHFAKYNLSNQHLKIPTDYQYRSQNYPIDNFEFCFMRKDPPVDLNYYNQVQILNQTRRTKVINNPEALLNWNEKVSILKFPDLIAPSLVTRSKTQMLSFIQNHEKIVIKPLNNMGGKGIIQIDSKNQDLNKILDKLADEYWMLQKFIPAITEEGDKRLILINGKFAGSFLRVAPANSFLANLSAGGDSKAYQPSTRDLEICSQLSSFLIDNGIFLAGIDIIGEYLTEINITSPGCLFEINQLSGVKLEEVFWDELIDKSN